MDTTNTTNTDPHSTTPKFVTLREASALLFGYFRYLDRWVQEGRDIPGVHRVGWAYVVELDVLAEAVRTGAVRRTRRGWTRPKATK